jgi:hypothetical protein
MRQHCPRAPQVKLVSCNRSSFMSSPLRWFRSRAAKRRSILAQGASRGFAGPHSAKSCCAITSTPQWAFPSWLRTPKSTQRPFTRCLVQTGIRPPGTCSKSLPICSTRKGCASKSGPSAPPHAPRSGRSRMEQGGPLQRQCAIDRKSQLGRFMRGAVNFAAILVG